jgi:hypothetical protein
MSNRFPPRYLPTLTEVVSPQIRDALTRSAVQAAPAVHAESATQDSHHRETAPPDRDELARQVIELVTPQLEAELRSVAQELFEAQFSSLLPSLYLQIEEAVRDAIDLALPDQINRND